MRPDVNLQFRPLHCSRKSSGISSWKQSACVCSCSRLIAHQAELSPIQAELDRSTIHMYSFSDGHNQAIRSSCQDTSWFWMPWVTAGKICFRVCVCWQLSGWLKSAVFHCKVNEISIYLECERWSYIGQQDWCPKFMWLWKCAFHLRNAGLQGLGWAVGPLPWPQGRWKRGNAFLLHAMERWGWHTYGPHEPSEAPASSCSWGPGGFAFQIQAGHVRSSGADCCQGLQQLLVIQALIKKTDCKTEQLLSMLLLNSQADDSAKVCMNIQNSINNGRNCSSPQHEWQQISIYTEVFSCIIRKGIAARQLPHQCIAES